MKSVILCFSLLFMGFTANAQNVGINASGTAPHSSAMLDVASNNKGFLVPRMDLNERNNIAAPIENGLIVYNTDCGNLNYYDCNTWREVGEKFAFPPLNGTGTGNYIIGNDNPSQNETGVVYLIPPISGAVSYSWTVPNGASITNGATTNEITVDYTTPGHGFICVEATNACGTKIQTCLYIVICPLPAAPSAIAGSATPNENSAGNTYSISAVPSANTYTWTVPVGATITAGQGTTSISVDFALGASNGNICVVANGDCGTGSATCVSLTMQCPIATVPTANAGTNINATDFDANWSASSGATGYYLDVSTDVNFGSFVSGFNNLSVGNVTTYNVTGLTCEVDYYYRVRAENACGTSNSSNVEMVTMGSCCTSGSITYSYTGAYEQWTVPSNTCNNYVTIEVWGAQGGNGIGGGATATNGLGGYAKGDKTVTGGDVLYIYVGQKGENGSGTGGGVGGWNGGGSSQNQNPTYEGGGGGGASDVRYNGQTLNDRIIVGGGAGGNGSWKNSQGGHGGYTSGLSGEGNNGQVSVGTGGSQSSGGTGGGSGSLGVGGNGGGGCGAGGGGGWYGGGGSSGCNSGGGGGGSSYIGGMDSNTSTQNGTQSGDGKVTITW